MSDQPDILLLTLPVELVYCILDFLEPLEILFSVRNVSTSLNAITNTFTPYQVSTVEISIEHRCRNMKLSIEVHQTFANRW